MCECENVLADPPVWFIVLSRDLINIFLRIFLTTVNSLLPNMEPAAWQFSTPLGYHAALKEYYLYMAAQADACVKYYQNERVYVAPPLPPLRPHHACHVTCTEPPAAAAGASTGEKTSLPRKGPRLMTTARFGRGGSAARRSAFVRTQVPSLPSPPPPPPPPPPPAVPAVLAPVREEAALGTPRSHARVTYRLARDGLCFGCGKPGHRKSQCTSPQEWICFSCGGKGHTAAACSVTK